MCLAMHDVMGLGAVLSLYSLAGDDSGVSSVRYAMLKMW